MNTLIVLIVLLAAVFGIIVALRPGEFRVVRSGPIPALPAVVFEHVNDLHKWQAWSPWARMDPNAKGTYEGPVAGTGAVFDWVGNKNIGEGRMTIIESRPNDLVRFKLEFRKPFAGTNIAEFNFKAEGGQTLVTWSMTGKYHVIMKAVGLFMNCDKMIGGQFEQGLANLKSVVEGSTK